MVLFVGSGSFFFGVVLEESVFVVDGDVTRLGDETVADQRSISNPIGVWFGPQDAAGQLLESKKSRGPTLVRCGNFATNLTSPLAMSGFNT